LGVGDILLRTKYRFSADVPVNLAGLFTLRLPTGKRTDFRGLGITTLQPALVLSRVHWGHDFHANVGVEVNTSHPDRSLGRYGLGATFRILPYLAGLVDVIGSSGLTDSSTTVTTGNVKSLAVPSVSQLNGLLGGSATIEDISFTRTATERRANIAILIPRTDLLDLAVGMKVSIVEGLVGFAQVVIPLNPDGVRANMVPVGGVEYGF
jgi:hypothetical protein